MRLLLVLEEFLGLLGILVHLLRDPVKNSTLTRSKFKIIKFEESV